MTDILDVISMSILGYFCANIVVFVLVLLGTVVSMLMKARFGRYFFHCAWCLMSLLMIIGFLLTSIMLPLGGIFFDTCDSLKQTFEDVEYYNRVVGADYESMDMIVECK